MAACLFCSIAVSTAPLTCSKKSLARDNLDDVGLRHEFLSFYFVQLIGLGATHGRNSALSILDFRVGS